MQVDKILKVPLSEGSGFQVVVRLVEPLPKMRSIDATGGSEFCKGGLLPGTGTFTD